MFRFTVSFLTTRGFGSALVRGASGLVTTSRPKAGRSPSLEAGNLLRSLSVPRLHGEAEGENPRARGGTRRPPQARAGAARHRPHRPLQRAGKGSAGRAGYP